LALDYECAKRIELLLQYASPAQLCQVTDAIAHKFVYLAEHHSASHVVQTMLVCVARALAAVAGGGGGGDDDDVASAALLTNFLGTAVQSMLNSFEQSAANRYAPHVFATLLRLLAGAPLWLERVELQRPGTVPGADIAGDWHSTSNENVATLRSVVDWLVALGDSAFSRLLGESVHSIVVLTTLLDITSDANVRGSWGKSLWQALVDKARLVDSGTLVKSAGGSLLFERILQTCPDEAAFNSLFDMAIKSRLVELATHAHANHVVATALKVSTDRALVRNMIRSLLPHIDFMLQTVVRRPVRGGNNKKKTSFEPISERRPVPLVVDAMCIGAQQHAIVPLQERLVAALQQFSIDSAKQTRYERALHHHFTKNPQVRTDDEFRASYSDSQPDVAPATGIGGLFRGLLELNQRFVQPKDALARKLPPKESFFSTNGSLILQSLLLFASPHCDAVVQSMIAAPAELLLVLARDKCSYVYDRVFSSATVSPQLKQQLVDQLIVNVVDMSMHNVASRVVEAAFAAADMERKRAIAQALAAQYDTIRATKPGSFVLRNCRVTNTGDVAVEWERKQAKVEHARRMFADIIESGAPKTETMTESTTTEATTTTTTTTTTTPVVVNNAEDDIEEEEEEELFGQPVEKLTEPKEPPPKKNKKRELGPKFKPNRDPVRLQKKAEKRKAMEEEKEARKAIKKKERRVKMKEKQQMRAQKKQLKKQRRAAEEAERLSGKKRSNDARDDVMEYERPDKRGRMSDERVNDDELARQMAEFDDYEPTTKRAATTAASARKWDMSALASLKPLLQQTTTAATTVVESADSTAMTKRKSKPNARSRRRLKRQEEEEAQAAMN
jgi:hypothetical protein